ncbi:MAG: hypothetical protein JW810_04790 [Sedimentisphaerales bacterium]|nr:hypothetical protein [Sedimentisphaerales bacterium]
MNFIKKRLFMILCIAVVVLGIGIFAAGMMVSAGNAKKSETIKTQLDQVGGLRTKAVSNAELEQAQRNAEMAQEQMETIQQVIRQTSRRPLLYEPIFPKLNNEVEKDFHFREFGLRYCDFIDRLLKQLNAGTCPTEQEEEQLADKFYQDNLQNAPGQGTADLRYQERFQIEKLINELRRKRAQEISVYADGDAFCCYGYWKSLPRQSIPMYLDSWFSQIAAWVQEDVVASILEVNRSANSVLDAPIKRLIEISFTGTPPQGEPTVDPSKTISRATSSRFTLRTKGRQTGATRRLGDNARMLPAYVKPKAAPASSSLYSAMATASSATAAVQYENILAIPFSQHATNDVIDVVQFEVGVVIDSASLQDFILALQSEKVTLATALDGTPRNQNRRNQITVLQVDVEPIDIQAEKDAGYFYGGGSLQVLRVTGEYIFFHKGYQDWMPQPVVDILHPPTDKTATTSSSSSYSYDNRTRRN